jgi:type I restriction enzyme S subunit
MNKELTMAKTSLPVGWEMKTLGEVCVKTETVNPKINPEKEFIYLDVSSVNKETKLIEATTTLLGKDAPSRARKLVKKDDVIFATVRPTHSRVALIPEDYNEQVCSTGYYVLRAKPIIENQFIFYYLLTDFFNELMESMQKGASYPAVTNKEVESVKIPLPPLPQQKQIVAILDKAFASIDSAKANAEQNLQNAKELFESYLQNVFENKGDDWEEKKLSEIADVIDSLHRTPKYSIEGYPMVRVTDIKPGFLNLSKTKKVDKNTFDDFSKKHTPKIGDIVLSRVGSYGVSAIVNTTEPFCLGQNTVFLIPKINSNYFYHFLNSPYAKKQIDNMVSGSTQPTISLKSIRTIFVPLPNIKTQEILVKKIETISNATSKLEAIYTQKIADLEEMKKSVLQKAFSGQLNTINESYE